MLQKRLTAAVLFGTIALVVFWPLPWRLLIPQVVIAAFIGDSQVHSGYSPLDRLLLVGLLLVGVSFSTWRLPLSVISDMWMVILVAIYIVVYSRQARPSEVRAVSHSVSHVSRRVLAVSACIGSAAGTFVVLKALVAIGPSFWLIPLVGVISAALMWQYLSTNA